MYFLLFLPFVVMRIGPNRGLSADKVRPEEKVKKGTICGE